MRRTKYPVALALLCGAILIAGSASGQLFKPLGPIVKPPTAAPQTAPQPHAGTLPDAQFFENAETAAAVKKFLNTPADIELTPVMTLDAAHTSVTAPDGTRIGSTNFHGAVDLVADFYGANQPGPFVDFAREPDEPHVTLQPSIELHAQVDAGKAYAIDCFLKARAAHYEIGGSLLDGLPKNDVTFSADPDNAELGHLVIATPRMHEYWNVPTGNLWLQIYLKSGKPTEYGPYATATNYYGCRIFTYAEVMRVNGPNHPIGQTPIIKPKPAFPPVH